MSNEKFRNQKTRYALRIPAKLQTALLPLIEKEDSEVALFFATVHQQLGGDVELPLTGAHMMVIARVAAQHFDDIPQAHNLFNAIAGCVA